MGPSTNRTRPVGRHNSSTSNPVADPRFSRLETDARFRLPSRKHTHVKLDKRFASLFHDEEFSRKARIDRYGRKLEKDAGKTELQRLYSLEDDVDGPLPQSRPEDESGEEDDVVQKELQRIEKNYDPARDGGFSESSSEEESSEDDEDEDEDEEEETTTVTNQQETSESTQRKSTDIPMGDITPRLACVNLDWDNIRAVDLMVVASSFAPTGGRIKRVSVFPSEFGKSRMVREEREGPAKELFTSKKKKKKLEPETDSEEEDDRIKKQLTKEDKGEELDRTALRRYQLDRLKYYYAVIECSSNEVAKALYDDMDSREYLSSANFFDIRFIPDEVGFDDDQPRDTCTETPEGYTPNEFVTEALRHSNVKLTWDADDETRKQVQMKAFSSKKEIDENDMQAYLGSGSSSEEEDGNDELLQSDEGDGDAMSVVSKATTRAERRDALRAALGLPPEPVKTSRKKTATSAPVGDIQVTFTPAITASEPKRGAVFQNKPPEQETTREKYVRKEKEKKERRKAKRQAAEDGGGSDDGAFEEDGDHQGDHMMLSGAEDEDDPFNDPFFTDPMSAKQEAKKATKAEKTRLKTEREAESKDAALEKAELELLMDDQQNMRHFDMKEILKGEKQAKKTSKRKGKGKHGAGIETEPKDDGFEMDVGDSRFQRLFDSHEFAIDPTNPRYKDTKAMKQLREQGRQKRAGGHNNAVERAGSSKRSRGEGEQSPEADGMKRLLERVKKRAKQ